MLLSGKFAFLHSPTIRSSFSFTLKEEHQYLVTAGPVECQKVGSERLDLPTCCGEVGASQC